MLGNAFCGVWRRGGPQLRAHASVRGGGCGSGPPAAGRVIGKRLLQKEAVVAALPSAAQACFCPAVLKGQVPASPKAPLL